MGDLAGFVSHVCHLCSPKYASIVMAISFLGGHKNVENCTFS